MLFILVCTLHTCESHGNNSTSNKALDGADEKSAALAGESRAGRQDIQLTHTGLSGIHKGVVACGGSEQCLRFSTTTTFFPLVIMAHNH